ncbi:MAG: hypothetical protein ACD_39C00176G0002 [uncultured bacterium]|nr:MAG: hypothetical protein ACD_39C00176G0002 [uncultured bacterium]
MCITGTGAGKGGIKLGARNARVNQRLLAVIIVSITAKIAMQCLLTQQHAINFDAQAR